MTGQTEPRLVDPVPFAHAIRSALMPTVRGRPRRPRLAAGGSLSAGQPGVRTPPRERSSGRAEDTVLRRDVAATAAPLRPGTGPDDGEQPAGREIIARALVVRSFEHPRLRRLLDASHPVPGPARRKVLGAAVAEWIPVGLPKAAADGMPQPLAAAQGPAAAGGRRRGRAPHGHVQRDHPAADPAQSRRSPAARLRAAATGLTPADDVRSGAAPTRCSRRSGRSRRRTPPGGLRLPEPRCRWTPPRSVVRPGVPVELETLVVGTLGTVRGWRVRTPPRCATSSTRSCGGGPRGPVPPEHDGVPPEPGDVAARARCRSGRPAAAALAVELAGLGSACWPSPVHERSLGELFGDPTPRIVVGSSAGGERGRRCGPQQADARRRHVGGRRRGQGRERTSTTTPGTEDAGEIIRGDRRQPQHGLEDLQYRQQSRAQTRSGS